MDIAEIEVLNQTTDRSLPTERLREAAQMTLASEGWDQPMALTILLSDDAELQRLNKRFRGEDKPTDVLSFSAGGPMIGPVAYLGDLAISVSTAARQAGSHSLEAELLLLTVHGVLHLLGYDHADEEERASMWSAQATILAQLGVNADEILGDTTAD